MKYRNDLKRRVLAGLFAGAALCLATPAALAAGSPIPNGTLPSGGHFMVGGLDKNIVTNQAGNQMNITQSATNAVIKWDSFNVGANATVNFKKDGGGNFNTLNYVNSANGMSQIYGAINAAEGNIYIVNPAGVEIGNSAQINVGSLYVSNRNLDAFISDDMEMPDDIKDFIQKGNTTDAVLMSLGNVNADHVTFDGARIVIDTERLKDVNGDAKLTAGDIIVRTNNDANVVIGYDAYVNEDKDNDGQIDGYKNAAPNTGLASVYVGNSDTTTNVAGYMWVEDVEQLQAIDTNLDGNYALRNSIDATATQDINFTSIGDETNNFNGRFDGLDYNIFNLNIDRADATNVGLFGVVGGSAVINNVTLVGGSITGGSNVGALAGSVEAGAQISNITNSASVTGASNVGGIVGASKGAAFTGLINTGTITSSGTEDGKGGWISNAGGLIGSMTGGTLGGTSYNLGSVTADGHNVGGLVGYAEYATIGNEGENAVTVYNRLNVTGAYNVGGIVGAMEDTTVQNAENSGNVSATGYASGDYKYHTEHYTESDVIDGVKTETVWIANAGGIAGIALNGSTLTDVLNTGDVSSATATGQKTVTEDGETHTYTYTYYTAGNVGGVVGSAVDTNITNATNRENEIRGAHNVGGIAGYFANSNDNNETKYTVTNGVNDGGDIMATGARNDSGFVKELVRPGSTGDEEAIIGNMGGIVGYMDGDNVFITGSANRGTVHSQDITGTTVLPVSQAANAGGIVGKIDRSKTLEREDGQSWEAALTSEGSSTKYDKAAVSNSYSTGDVRGYMGVGGIAGMMYNGEIAGSYNLGTVNTTRNKASFASGNYYSVNMGGIVGDTTEQTEHASALLYDVYNKGQIGDETFTYYARHVGGIVGRLSGTVEKAYNTGAIYNGYNVVGGIVGWMYKGSVTNAFNTGNITVYNQEEGNTAGIQAGGIAGGARTGFVEISNVYNLGTIRGFQDKTTSSGNYAVGGIVGAFIYGGSQTISNAYTTGNLYLNVDGKSITSGLGSIYGLSEGYRPSMTLINTYYIRPDKENGLPFTDLHDENNTANDHDNSNKAIDFTNKDKAEYYTYEENGRQYSLSFTQQQGGDVDGGNESVTAGDDNWRIYAGSTPILNAFLPNAEKYFADKDLAGLGVNSIQYGTAYDPLLTIVNAADGTANLTFDWQDLGINNDAGLAVYGAGLTLNDFMATGGSGYFGGLIYSDGALTLNAHLNGDTHDSANTNVTGDVALGSASQLYGSSVTIDAEGQVTIYGSVTATGNVQDGTSWNGKQYTETLKNTDGDDFESNGSISITGGSVDIYGQLTSADGQSVKVPGINGMASGWTPGTVSDPHVSMSDIGDRFSYTTQPSGTLAQTPGNISITANDKTDGHVNVYYGNKGEGLVTTGGNLEVTASGDIYMDSDLDVGGNITFDAPGEKVLDLTNIGKVRGESFMEDITAALQQAGIVISNPEEVSSNEKAAISAITEMLSQKYGMEDDSIGQMPQDIVNTLTEKGVDWLAERVNVNRLHEFLDHFSTETGSGTIAFKNGDGSAADSSKITVDMWDYENNRFDLGQFDLLGSDAQNGKFVDKISALNLSVAGNEGGAEKAEPKAYTYIWVSTGEQLAGIQQYYDDPENVGTNILSYNFALKNDIDASDVTDYTAIGTGSENGYTGTFDGRDHRIIGLKMEAEKDGDGNGSGNAGIFDTIGENGTVEDLRVYSGSFTGTDNAGAVAGVNNGTISNVTAFGNVVTAKGSSSSTPLPSLVEGESDVYVGAAGGIAGVNAGKIDNASAIGTATAANAADESGALSTAGGIAGINQAGAEISDSTSNSAVDASAESTYALGGVAGVNAGKLENVDSLGVTTGVYKGNTTQYSDNVGGIAGINQTGGTVENVYNESIVSGRNNVGGILGTNLAQAGNDEKSPVSNVANAADVTGESAGNDSEFVGGLVGNNEGSITNGRNNGEITGNNYVGGLVGANRVGADDTEPELTNLVNDSAAAITGDNYVGGIAGSNEGTISANEQELINRGTITGQQYVGGVAGLNTGKISNTNNNVELYVKDPNATGDDAPRYFGGVAGMNGYVDKTDETKNKTGIIENAKNEATIIAEKADFVGGIVGWNTEAGVLQGMGNSNEGIVEGASHVGGVAGKNDADIAGTVASMVGIENSGVVIAHNGGAGGIFGENTGDIQYAEMTNNGIVSGTYSDNVGENGTGGIFGVNSGDVQYSSMKNEIGGQVMGTQNVGGLIGVNTGTITGGRDENDGYYKYQIYNNGTIKAGTWSWDDRNGDSKIDDVEISFEAATEGSGSQNIAGLIGINQKKNDGTGGTITAAYNTGAVNADSSENVGGIAGTNAGKLDQVFNTVITEDGRNQTIIGGTNVGGIAGDNTGTIFNAYNTTTVMGTAENAVTGSIAGINTNTISNVYGIDSLVGNGSVSHGYNLSEAGSWKNSSSYKGFDFDSTDNDGTASIWKIYEGSTNPLLKVFLTKVTVHPDKLPDFAADGNEHTLDVGDLIQSGALTAPGNFGAYWGNTNLIQSNSHSAMGTYDDWLHSLQIAAGIKDGIFNPNLLGYDIDLELGIGLPPDTVEPPVNEHWNFLFDDNPWDRNRDFRERKANIHFIAGGMTL